MKNEIYVNGKLVGGADDVESALIIFQNTVQKGMINIMKIGFDEPTSHTTEIRIHEINKSIRHVVMIDDIKSTEAD